MQTPIMRTTLSVSLLLLSVQASAAIFTDIARESGLDFTHFNGMTGDYYFPEMTGQGGALIDFDNDGDLDLYLVQGSLLGKEKGMKDALFPTTENPPRDRLYRNDLVIKPDGSRELRFTDVTETRGIEATGYGMGVTVGDIDNDGYDDLYVTNYGPNQLWRNNGDGTFSDVTAAAGVLQSGRAMGVSACDFDEDGWLALIGAP